MISKKICSVFLALVLAVGMCPSLAFANTLATASISTASTSSALSYDAELTFSNSGITASASGTGYSISGTTLKISANGVYKVSGSCSEGNIEIAKELTDVTLVLDGLSLTSSGTAPIVVKKNTTASIHLLDGTSSTLTDNENPANETSSDTDVADAFEGAAIKVKSGSNVTFCGGGTLTANGSSCKNAIKGASESSLVFNSGTYVMSAANNGIAADGSVTINGGTFDIDAENDGIKSVPDADDTASAGNVTINGGTFDIDVKGDGISAETTLTITNGTFDIKTLNGYNSGSAFNSTTMSCKGIKASGDRTNISNTLQISGGTFNLNTADDAVHSDTYALVTGGTFDIATGDDGMHADTTLTIGTNGGLERDPDITIQNSYEGLEGGTVNIYSGRMYVVASDDGINAADGSGSGSTGANPFGGGEGGNPRGNDNFNTGGGGPGSNGGGFGGGMFGPHSVSTESVDEDTIAAQATSSYSLNVYGGKIFVNCNGDGLDSNGSLTLSGGEIAVFSMAAGGDNSAIDSDGTTSINGATVFTAGSAGMDGNLAASNFGNGQKYVTSTTSYAANTVVNALSGSTTLASYQLPKRSTYTMYTAPGLSSAPTLATATSTTACKGGSWSHSWNAGTTSNGVTTYTCSTCGATERQTVATTTTSGCSGHTASHGTETATDSGYAVTFSVDHATVNVYYTQDYTSPDKVGVTSTVSRNSDTGEPDSSGDGQVNFTVVPASGYEVASVSATEGAYKNIKGPDDTGVANTYRITKITGVLTVTIATKATSDTSGTGSDTTDTDSTDASTGSDTRIDLANATISKIAKQGYTGKAITPNPTVKVGTTTLTEGKDYTLSYKSNVKRGTATVIITALAGSTKYTGSTTKNFTIVKGTNTMKVASSAKTVSQYKVASASKKLKALYVTGAKGNVKYTRVSGSKYLKVNSAGRIVVAKGTPAGTYKVKVKVRAAGNSNYNAKTVTKNVKVTVR